VPLFLERQYDRTPGADQPFVAETLRLLGISRLQAVRRRGQTDQGAGRAEAAEGGGRGGGGWDSGGAPGGHAAAAGRSRVEQERG
jgi:hypothetical protein